MIIITVIIIFFILVWMGSPHRYSSHHMWPIWQKVWTPLIYNIYNTGHGCIPLIMNQATGWSKFGCGAAFDMFGMLAFSYKYHELAKKHLLEWCKKFLWSDPLHFSFKTCVDQQFAGKNLLQSKSFFISLNFFTGETFKIGEKWGCNSIVLPIQWVHHSLCITSLLYLSINKECSTRLERRVRSVLFYN